MSKTKSTARPSEPQALNLADLRFMVERSAHFVGEKTPHMVPLTGDQVVPLLEWFVRAFPTGKVDQFTDPGSIGLELEAFAKTCSALADTDWDEQETGPVFYALSRTLVDLSLRLIVGDVLGEAPLVTVSIEQPAAAVGGAK